MPFDASAVEAIAKELGARISTEPYQVQQQPVYRLSMAGADGLVLLLWPQLGRADVRVGRVTLVLKLITQVEVLPGVEVIFRRADGGRLFVTPGGQVNLAV